MFICKLLYRNTADSLKQKQGSLACNEKKRYLCTHFSDEAVKWFLHEASQTRLTDIIF